ncbi:MAG: hypothetical protein E4G91_01320 [Candidatus Zixiibacteriota bacterium]|nr:MAG: hypothetical protein E4G91_01320 [candidate division Zixibacteria bacterium]
MQTGKTPKMLLEQPELLPLLSEEWDAFATLDKARQHGFSGPQPITLTEIEAFCRLNDPPDRDQLIKYIQKLDEAYLRWYVKKQ